MELKVIGWIDYNHTHIESAKGTSQEIDAVVKNIQEHKYKFGGDDHENHSHCCPVLSNGEALRLSWREWGYVMAKAYDLKTENGEYNYILWYMGEYGPEERKYPSDFLSDIESFPKADKVRYDIDDIEYKSFNYYNFSILVAPDSYIFIEDIYTFDEIDFYYKDKLLMKTVVDLCPFYQNSLDELTRTSDLFPTSNTELTNFRYLDKEQIKKLTKEKFNDRDYNYTLIKLLIKEDYRDSNNLEFE